jgi:hypothetical protein
LRAPDLVLRREVLHQLADRQVTGIDPLFGSRPVLDQEASQNLVRDFAQPLITDRCAPALLLERAAQLG